MATAKKLNGTLRGFIEKQPMFFVATAGKQGRVNVSPKGIDTLKIIDDNHIRWLNLSGSGNETATHVAENGHMTLMFCAFEGDARILRTFGSATVLHPRDDEWNEAIEGFETLAGSRQIFDLNIDLVQTSCGTGVPLMDHVGGRGEVEMVPYFEDLGDDGVREFWKKKNSISIDGQPTGIFEDV